MPMMGHSMRNSLWRKGSRTSGSERTETYGFDITLPISLNIFIECRFGNSDHLANLIDCVSLLGSAHETDYTAR
jgi:hypothetical protein